MTGYTIPDSEPEALCDKLSWLLGDSHLRETMGLRAAEYALDYGWEKIATQIVDVYDELVENKKLVIQESDEWFALLTLGRTGASRPSGKRLRRRKLPEMAAESPPSTVR